jgi:hypothetical protein
MTQVDRIEDHTDNTWVDLLTGNADRFDGWLPKLGIYPVRLAGPKEIKAGLAPSQMRVIEHRLFKSPEWMNVAQKAGRGATFGFQAARQKVLAIHRDRIANWYVHL